MYNGKLEGGITILINRESTTIEIRDKDSNTRFLSVTLTPEQLSSALSRLSETPCELKVRGLDRVGKIHECKSFDFEIPENLASKEHSERLSLIANLELIDGWECDQYFGSRNSFFTKDGKQYAHATIRRWIDK